MTFNDLLQIELNSDAISKIEGFIGISKNTNKIDYFKALILLARVYKNIDDENKSIAIIEELLNEGLIKRYQSICVEAIDVLIDIYLENEDFEECHKYIIYKKDFVGSKEYLYLYDFVVLYDKEKRYEEEKKIIVELLNKDIPDKIREDILLKIIDIFIYEEAYEYALMYIKTLFDELDLSMNKDVYEINFYKSCLVKYCLNDYSYIDELEAFEPQNKEISGKVKILLINTYMKFKNYKRASLVESEFDSVVNKFSDEIKREFYIVAINLYEETKNLPAKEYYEAKLNSLKIVKLESKQVKKDLKIILNQKSKKIDQTKEELYRAINEINNLINELSDVSVNQKIRDIILNMGRILYKKIKIKDMIILYNEEYYHFKKDRVYDKSFSSIKETLFEVLLEKKEEIVYSSKQDLVEYIDIITNEPFVKLDYQKALVEPIKNGGVVVLGDEKLFNNFNYELLKSFIKLLEFKFNHYNYFNNHVFKTNMYEKIIDNLDVLIKYQKNDEVYLSFCYSKLLNVAKNIDYETYLSKLDYGYINYYKEYFLKQDTLKYEINGKYYLENIKKLDEFEYLSVITDITEEKRIEETLENNIYKDFITNLKNKRQLEQEFKINYKKLSIVIVDIFNFKEINEIYGYIKANQILRELAVLFVEYFSYDLVYKLSSDEFLIILDYNDQRRVMKELNNTFRLINQRMKKFDRRLDIYLIAGVVRYPTQTNDDRIDKLVFYANQAKRLAKINKLPNMHKIMMFNNQEYKNILDEDITSAHINEAIDNDLIRINYTPIINKETKRLKSYYITFRITNYDIEHEKIIRVAKLRNILKSIEFYLIKKSLEQLNEVIKNYNKYYNIIIPINNETIDDELIDFLSRYKKSNPNLLKALTLEIDDSTYINKLRNLGIHVASRKIDNLYLGIDYFLTDINQRLTNESIKALYDLTNSLKTELIILNDTNLDISLVKTDINLTYLDVLKRVKK